MYMKLYIEDPYIRMSLYIIPTPPRPCSLPKAKSAGGPIPHASTAPALPPATRPYQCERTSPRFQRCGRPRPLCENFCMC